jgi:hypothetical protein
MRALALAVLLFFLSGAASASETAAPRLADLAWLEGRWQGPGIGGAPATEVYSAPAGGQMLGHFQQLNGGGTVLFYELLALVERDGRLAYRIKHFHPDLGGWEERDEVREFLLVSVTATRWDFSGLVLERITADRLRLTVNVAGEGGAMEPLVFDYRRY